MTSGGVGKNQTNSWKFSADAGDAVIVRMGDLVLTEDEVQPVMKKLQDGGIAELQDAKTEASAA